MSGGEWGICSLWNNLVSQIILCTHRECLITPEKSNVLLSVSVLHVFHTLPPSLLPLKLGNYKPSFKFQASVITLARKRQTVKLQLHVRPERYTLISLNHSLPKDKQLLLLKIRWKFDHRCWGFHLNALLEWWQQ